MFLTVSAGGAERRLGPLLFKRCSPSFFVSFSPVAQNFVHSIRSGRNNLIGAFSLPHALDLSSYLNRNHYSGDYQRTISTLDIYSPKERFLLALKRVLRPIKVAKFNVANAAPLKEQSDPIFRFSTEGDWWGSRSLVSVSASISATKRRCVSIDRLELAVLLPAMKRFI